MVWYGNKKKEVHCRVDVWWHGFGKSLEIVSVVVRFGKSLEGLSVLVRFY